MGQVLIIKNNSVGNSIYRYAKQSFDWQVTRYYNTKDNTENEEAVREIKETYKGEGFVLLVTMGEGDDKECNDLFIGIVERINETDNIEYKMKIHFTQQDNRVIKSIIDKIDLDATKDFPEGHYIIMNEMESLYQELRERIAVKEKSVACEICIEENKQETRTYCFDKYAERDESAIRIYAEGEEQREGRTEFQQDRERIVSCAAFRRLVDKAQIFSAEKGDYFRTRMTHSLEVNQIAKAIAYALGLNLDLTEAIALGHDLGHTPFGHQGERTLDNILCGKTDVGIVASERLFQERCFGGFKHNYQSARVLTELEEMFVEFPGLNVSVQVVEGVLKHTKMKSDIEWKCCIDEKYGNRIEFLEAEEQVCATLEGQVVKVADEIAQRGHDVDDALTSGVMSISEFIDRLKVSKCSELEEKIAKEIKRVEKSQRNLIDSKALIVSCIVSTIVNYLITTTIANSKINIEEVEKNGGKIPKDKPTVAFASEVEAVNSYLERVVQKKVICNSEVARADYNADAVIKKLFQKYYSNPRLLPEGMLHKIFLEMLKHKNGAVSNSAINLNDGDVKLISKELEEITLAQIDENKVLECLKNNTFVSEENDIVVFEKRKILVHVITDYIAGMTDGYALEEFEKLR